MQAEFLDVAEDEEGVLDYSVFDYLLQVLILDQVRVDKILNIGKRQPDYQVRLER